MSHMKITQIKSSIGCKPKQRGTLRALGLRGIGKSNIIEDGPVLQGMLARVPHLVTVVEADSAPAPKARASKAASGSEATSATVDSDADGEANATDASPYGDGSHALIDGDPDIMPDGFPIKGNAESKLYHNENSSFYGRTKAEVWFASDAAAEAAGFSKPPSQLAKEEGADS